MSNWSTWFFGIDEEFLQEQEKHDKLRQENSRMIKELGPKIDLLIQNRNDWEECAHKLAAAVDALQGYCRFYIPEEGYAWQNVSFYYHRTVETVYGAWGVYNQLKGEGEDEKSL